MTKVIEHGDIGMIEVPEDVSFEGNGYNNLYTGNGEYELHSLPYSELPPIKTGIKTSEYKYLGLGSELTEEQWGKVVENSGQMSNNYKDYEGSGRYTCFTTATESGHSLLSKHGLTPSTTLILIKQ